MLRLCKKAQDKMLFDTVCRLAKEQNEKWLTDILQSGAYSHLFEYKSNPIISLAMQGEHRAVAFLIIHLKEEACRDYAVLGYAMGGYVEEVERQVEAGASRDYAVLGYAMGGYVEEVERQIAAGASRHCAAQGYAMGGYVEEVERAIAKGVSRDNVVWGYAVIGYVEEVNRQVAKGASQEYAMAGYRDGHYLNQQEGILRLVASTHDEYLRKLLVKNAKYEIDSLDAASLLSEATKLNQLMHACDLTFDQAQGYLKAAANIWLFQGQELVKRGVFSAEIYIHIASFITGCSTRDTVKLFDLANKRLRDNTVKKNKAGFFSFFKTTSSLKKRAALSEERYQRRIHF